jgi:hypothetical protein
MHNKRNIICPEGTCTCLLLACFLFFFPLQAEGRGKVTVNADIVNAYVWRGQYVTGASIQPMVNLTFGDFQINTWGNSDIARGDDKELDLMLRYTFDGLTVGLSDYWISNEKRFNLFDFEKTHYLELNLDYRFNRVPLKLSWNTMFAGADKYMDVNGEMKNAYSTYIEATYSFEIAEIGLDAVIGCSPWRSMAQHTGGYPYATDGFAVVDISLRATRSISITDNYSFDVFGHIIINPAKEDAFFVFGISL